MLSYISLFIVYSSSLPAVFGWSALPPLSMECLILLGTSLFAIDAYMKKQYQYVYATTIGLVLQSIILFKIMYNH